MLWEDIKTASDLKRFVENGSNDPYFFTRDTMRFFGDTMRNYGIRWHDHKGGIVELYRRRPVKHGLQSSAYFAVADEGSSAKRVHINNA